MTKYQDALNLLKSWAKKDRNAYSPKHLENINDRTNVLQELVDKAKPKKVKVITLNGYDWGSMNYIEDKEYCCPACGETLGGIGSYCDNCGQKLEGE